MLADEKSEIKQVQKSNYWIIKILHNNQIGYKRMKRMKLILVITLLIVTGLSINGIGLNPIKPYHLNKGKVTKYLFSLITQEQITSKAKIKVTFPAEFDQSAIASNPKCLAMSDSYAWKSVTCEYKIDSIILGLEQIKDQKMDILIESPRNPVIYSMSSYFSICLVFDNSVTSCKKEFGKVVFPQVPVSATTTVLTPVVTSLSSTSVGKASTYQFKFTTTASYGTGNTIRVTLPKGYTTTANPVCQMSGTYNQIIKTFVWPNQRSIECQLVNKTISTDEVLKIIGIYNPDYAGVFGVTNDEFIIQILEGTTTVVLEEMLLKMTVTILAGELSGSILQTNRFIKSKSKYTFYLNLQNALSSSEYIRIRMLNSWKFYQNECTVVSGITLGADNTLKCINSTDSTYTYLNISNFASASITNQLVFNVYVGTPLTIGAYDVYITTSNPNGIMDQVTLSVSLNETYGSLDMLSINAITANDKVPVAGTGPLELTFFLNYELPQTNVLTDGIFYLKIYPQIPKPPQLINGVLKCYFYNDIPASTCTWDTTNAAYTLVTIKTPETHSFQYSQIPITITTQGAVNTSMIGITIADKVTRYRFELQAYKQDNLTTPTQVYYTEYIADPIALTMTFTAHSHQVNQYTGLKIDFTNHYSFTNPLMENIRFKIQFLAGGGWADNLGYQANKIYKRFPCTFYYNDNVNPATYDSHIRCDLYTYLTGPHASLTDNSNRGPYILMYGFTNQLMLSQIYRIQLAKFLIGSSTGVQSKIRFSIIEETPTMLTKYIELYYKEATVFSTVAQQIPTATANSVTVTASNSLINVATTHTNTFTVGSNSVAIIYEYDTESTPSFTNKLITCTTSNKCVYFGYPVNWIIEYPVSSFASAVSSSLPVTNGIYGGTYTGKARAFSSAGLTLFKGTFNVVYNPNSIVTAYFYKDTASYNTLYKGAEVYYIIYFDAIASTPANGFIRLIFSSNVVLSSQPYCKSTIGLYIPQHGLLCKNQNSDSTLKIYNIQGLSAGSRYQFTVRFKTLLTTGGTVAPTVTIKTYYSNDVDYSVIDQKNNHGINQTETNYYTIPNQFSVQIPKITSENPRINYIGSFVIMFRPSSDSLAAAKITVELPNHSWNGGYWTTPNNLATDPLVCFINSQRVACTYTLTPFKATLVAQNLLAGSDNKITLTTQYLPQNGLKHPSQGGEYISILNFLDASNGIIEANSFYHRVLPRKLRRYTIDSAVNDIGVENMFSFQIQIGSPYPNSYSDGTTYSRMLFEFPTVDDLGNALFEDDLGGYTKTGQYVGCYMYPYSVWSPRVQYIESPTNNLKCRLIKSEVTGEPAIVEVLNFGAFSSTYYRMRLRMARIYNPARAVVSVPISVRINHVVVATNDVYQLYYDTFHLFMNSQNSAPLTDTVRGCDYYTADFTADNYEVGDLAWMRFYPRRKDVSSTQYYYVIKLPADHVPANVQVRNPNYCHSSYHYECMAFPQISYIIIHSFTDNFEVRMDVNYPLALTQDDYNVAALVWQNKRYKGIDYITMTDNCRFDYLGTLVSYNGMVAVGSTNSVHTYKTKHQITIDFTLRHAVPEDGSIQIVFNPQVTATYPHCRSMVNLGSQLYAKGGVYNGEIGCLVQSSNTWVITGFQALGTSARVIIMGQFDINGNQNAYLGWREIISYNNTHPTNIRINGFVIDYAYITNNDFYINYYNSMNFDPEVSLEQTLPLRVNYVGPLQFKFRLASTFTGPNSGKIRVRIPRRSVYGQTGGFGYDATKKIVCEIKEILTNKQIGCIVTAVTDDTTSGSENIMMQMISSSTLATTTTYTMMIKTHTGVDPEGLIFPTMAGTYKVDVSFDVDNSNQYNIHDHLYLQVYGTKFTTLSVRSFSTRCNEMNILWVKLAPTTTISATDQIVIEIPTRASSGTTLFSNDLGTGLADGAKLTTDIVGGTFSVNFMNCRLFWGDQTYYKSTKIICSNFTESIENTELLYFAFKVVNPTVNPQASIPFFVYSLNTNTMYKSNFNTVENAVYLRNTYAANNYDDVGNVATPGYQMQTQGTYIQLIGRFWWTTTSQDYYILFFGFPLRNNGVISNGCKTSGGGTTLGNAYYHQNLWVIICDFTVNNLGPPAGGGYVSRTLRIEGFYSPWFYLSSSQRQIYGYHHWSNEYTFRGKLTDGFPDMNPKTTTTATFTLTPMHQTSTMYKGARDDYTIQFAFSSSASVDISYMKLIAVIFPVSSNADYVLLGQDCVEAPSSQVEIAQCWIVPGTRVMWIRPVIKTSYTSNLNIAVTTRNLAIRNPINTNTVYKSWFTIKFYGWENITQPSPDPINANSHCFLIINNLPASTYSYSDNPTSYPVGTFSYLKIPHQKYYRETPYSSLTHSAPLQFMFRPDTTFPTVSGASYHTIQITYGTIFTDNAQFKLRDLQVYRPVCYLANYRVRKCTIDTTANVITMNFQFGLTLNTNYHVYFSVVDPRNPDVNGFLPTKAISDIRVEYKFSGSANIYYTQTQKFPTLYSLPTGVSQGPFRGITAGAVEYGHAITGNLNVINLRLTFNRTDITGLVFEIPLMDEMGTLLYTSVGAQTNAFLNTEDGAPYPCGNHGLNAGGNVKCFIKLGVFGQLTIPTKIIMTDFTYVSTMNCRFIFTNPETAGAFFSIKVRAYGGTKSSSNLYGDKYMGMWQFSNIFQTVAASSYPPSSTSYDCSGRLPSKSPWRNNTVYYVFSRNQAIVAGRMSMAEVLMYDSGSSYNDDQFCHATLGSGNDYDDLLEYTKVVSGRTYRYSYFVRTWASNTNNQPNGGWDLQYLKCKFFANSVTAYWYFGDASIEIATNTFTPSNALNLANGAAPINSYYDQTYRLDDGTDPYYVVELDLTPMLSPLTDLYFRNNDNFTLSITFSNMNWGTTKSCSLLGGVTSTSETDHAYCTKTASDYTVIVTNFKGFQVDPLLPVSKNMRLKVLIRGDILSGLTSIARTITVSLFSNYDAFSNSYQAIVRGTATQIDNCYYPVPQSGTCYVSHTTGGGTFQLQQVTDTFLRVAFQPSSGTLSYGGGTIHQYYDIKFSGFNYGTACTITSMKMEISTQNNPGTGDNATATPNVLQCMGGTRIRIHFYNVVFNAIWGGLAPAANDNAFNSTDWIIFYLTIAPGADTQLPALHHEYIFAVGVHSYYNGGYGYPIRKVDFLDTQPLATSVTISAITQNRGGVTQFAIEVDNLQVGVGSSLTGYLLLAEFTGSTSWTAANDPFASYVNTVLIEHKIECKCLSAIGSISITTTSPYVDAVCRRRLPVSTGFNAYAILIDFNANAGQDVKCYFPQFTITSGMSFTVQLKVVYGNSYPPDLTDGKQYGSPLRTTSNPLTYSGSTPGTSYNSGLTLTQTPNIYASAVTVGSAYTSTYTLNGTWGTAYSTPYVYINFRKGGPIPAASFCSDSNIYLECRVYKNYLNLVIAKLKSSSVSTFSMSRGSMDISYPTSQWSDSSTSAWYTIVFIGTTQWYYSNQLTTGRAQSSLVPISSNTFLAYSDLYGSSRSTFNNVITLSLGISGKTLYRYIDTGSKIVITFSGVSTQRSNCQVWVQNQMSIELTCVVGTGVITIYSQRFDYTTNNLIFVTLGINNPQTPSVTFTMNMYDYYYSSSRNSLVISKQATFTIDNTFSSNIEIAQQRVYILPFRSRFTLTANTPLRIRFKLTSSIAYNPTYPGQSGIFRIINDQIGYSTNFLCHFREYTSYTNLAQQTQYRQAKATSYTVSGTQLDIVPPRSMTLNSNYYYELIVMPLDINSAGCTALGCASQAGFQQVNFELINMQVFSNRTTASSIVNHQVQRLFKYEGSSRLALQEIYVLCAQPVETSLYFKFQTDFTSAYDYPNHYLQFVFWDLPPSSFPGFVINDQIPCQLSSNFLSISNRKDPACILAEADNVQGFVKVRIINIGTITAGNYYFMTLDDITLPTPNGVSNTGKFDMSLLYVGPSNVRHQSFYREIFLIDNTIPVSSFPAISMSFTTPSITQFGSTNVGSLSFTWPFDTTAITGYESKVSFNINGGFSATWPSIDSVTFIDNTGTYQLLWVNKKLNKFVFAVPAKTATATVLNITAIKNPYPYQQQVYVNSNAYNIQVNFYNNYLVNCRQVFNQPAFSVFTKAVAIINIDQNLPSNTFDIYPSTNKVGSGATTTLRLGLVISETGPNIYARDINVLDIEFTAGVSYLDECRIVRNDSQYVNANSTCQTKVVGSNWHVIFYNFKQSRVGVYWWIQVVGKFSASTIGYTSRLTASNGVVQYESPYTVTMSNYYSTSKQIPTTTSWLNRKYVYNFFENQFRYLQAVSGQTTPYYRVKMTIAYPYDGSNDYAQLYMNSPTLFSSQTSSTNLICQILPALNGQRDFSIGYYAECYKSYSGGNVYYHLYGPIGGWANGDYLLQISQPNVVTTSFTGPTAPGFQVATFYQIHDGNTHWDNIEYHFKQFFTSVQILHTTTTVSDYDTLTITYTPKSSVSVGDWSRETVLMLDVSGLYHDYDGGISAIYAADGDSVFNSGDRFSEVVSNPTVPSNPVNSEVTTVLFSQYSQKMAPLRFSLAKMQAYTAGTSYTWRIPLIKNPATAYIALRYTLTLMHYPYTGRYGIIYNQHECINEYYTQADTSTVFSPSIINTNRNVQVTSAIDLAISLDSYSLAQWDSVIFKLDNSYFGLIQNFLNGNDTSNYNYYYFHTINMILAQKKSTSTVTNVGIGGLSSTINYARDFKFSWVKVHDSSNAPTTTNPKTLKYGNPPSLTLNYLTSYSSAVLTKIQGVQYQGCAVMYKLDITVPIIPKGGQIQITFDNTKISSDSGAHCRVRSGFTRTTDDQVLRCYRKTGGYRITGFSAIANAASLSMYFMMKSIAGLTAQNIAVNLYGLYDDSTSSISKKPNTVTATHAADSIPYSLFKYLQVKQRFYSSVRTEYYYELEGNLNLRNNNLEPGDYIRITNPLGYNGNWRFIIKKNDSSTVEWIQLIPAAQSSTVYTFTVPPVYLTNFSLVTGSQYIWKFTPYDTTYYNSGRENGFIPGSSGTQKIWYQGIDNGAYTQTQYYDFVTDPKPNVLTIKNRYPSATHKTMIDLSFYLDVYIYAGDWIELTFDTNSLLYDMFANDIEGEPVTGETYKFLDCREYSGGYISSGRMRCIVYYGDSTANPPRPARLIVPLELNQDCWTWPGTVKFMIANVLNPYTVGMNVGIQMNIMRTCANTMNKNCSVYSARGWYVTTTASENLQSSASTFTPSSNNILDTSITHAFQFVTTAAVGVNDVIYIIYPQNFQGVMPSTCQASNYYCYAFPKPRWIVLIPSTTVIGAAGTLSISLTVYMNNAYYTQSYTQYIKVVVSRGSGASAGDIYNIMQNPFITIKKSLSSGVTTSMTISTTQTPNIWLRNYANTAIFDLDNIFMDARIKAIYLKAPISDVTSWTADYCNASLTGSQVNTYPLRFTCRVFTQNTTNPMLQIIPQTQDLGDFASNANTWDDLTVRVHAKFTLSAFSAGQPILYTTLPQTSGTFNAYGSVNTTSVDPKYYLSQCSNTIQISQHQVPIISDITFDQDSFAYRVARVNKKQVFYLLLKPTVSSAYTITQMVFQIPVEFDYPGIFSHDNCFMIGRQKQDQDLCKQSREGGRTLIKVTPQNYNNEVKIIQLGSVVQQNWFTAPSLPGNFYNMTVQLYGIGGVLLQKQTIDISPIYGEYFDIPSIILNNIQDGNIAQSVYDLTFVTGTLQIPPGAKTTATTLTSEMRFIFQNYNANDPTNVFKNDLGTKLAEGSEVGCVIRSGIVALEGKRLICILHIGTNSTDKPMITILNYNYINAGTTIKLSFGGIQSLNQVNVNTISLSVLIHYNDINSSTYLYMPTPTLPDPTNNTLTLTSDRNANISGSIYTWHNLWSMSCAYSGNNILRQPTNFSVTIYPPNSWPFGNTQYSSSGAQADFILLKFNPKYVIDPYNPVTISCAYCTYVEVFYATGIVRFRHNRTIYGSPGLTFSLNNFPSSAFTISNLTVSVNVEIYSNYRLYAYKNLTVSSRTVQKCALFTFGVLSVSSLNGGQIGVTYTFSLITNHYIPANGAISITIPTSYGNMVSNNVTCTLLGFQATNAYCLIQTPSRVDIYLNGSLLTNTASYKVVLAGLQNPNQDSSSLIFYVSSYYDSNIYLGRKICENSVTPPAITVKTVRTCTISWSASYVNKNFNASHSFVLSCNDLFRGDSILYIVLPSQFSSNNTKSELVCTSQESTTLVEDKCYLNYINGSFTLWTKLQATSQTSLTILINLINPTNNTYSSSATVQSKGVVYAQAQDSYLTIQSTSYTTASSSSAFLMNSPKQAGLMATYIFKISPITSYTPNNLGISFPDNFHIDSTEITVGITSSENSRLFSSLNYDNVQKIINNISAVDGVSLKGYPKFAVESNAVHLSNISQYISTSGWTYVFIRGIKNPAQYLAKNFTLTYYIDSVTYRTLQWFLQAPLTYYISSPPQYLSINRVSVSDFDLLYPAVYTFAFSASNGNKIAIQNKQLSYIVVIPNFYKSTVWANGQLTCKFAQLAVASPCQNYETEVIVTETFPANFTSLTLQISTILNPSLETFCNTTDVTLLQQTFFRIRIIQVVSNKFMFESSSVVDGSNCLRFFSSRIPISLEHPLVMVAGLAYNITYGISKPASNLKIKASTSANGFTFLPETVQFNDYYTLKKSTTIYLRSDIPPGNYTINFDKFETQVQTYFRNILPTTVQVVSSSSQTFIRPIIKIPSISVSTIGYPVVVPIQFSLPSSTQMTLFIKIAEQSNQTLTQYSQHFSNFSLAPRIINIIPQQTNFSFTITQSKLVVPPPLTLQFTLTSVYTIIHNLTTPSMTVCFDRDPTYDVLYPPLRVRLTQFASACSTADVGKRVTNIMISNSTSESSSGSMKPQIITMSSSNIRSSGATITINTRTGGTLYYLCLDAGYPTITNVDAIIALNNTDGYIGTITSVAQNVYISNAAQINYKAILQLTKLHSSTKYKFYAVLKSELGTSQIKTISFETIDLSKGVLMKLTFNDIVANLDIVKSLQRIMRISPLRIKVMTSTHDLQLIRDSANQYKNNPKYVYEIVIAPDPTNDTTTPLSIVETFLQSTTSKASFKEYLPPWDQNANVQYYQLRSVKPRITIMPAPKVINLYNVTFTVKFWQRANIYAILVQQKQKAEDTMNITQKPIIAQRVGDLSPVQKARSPSSLQIRNGRNIDNSDATKYKKFNSMTDDKGNGAIFFDDLKPGSIYQLYITSSSYLPYQPTLLWEDSEVLRIRFETLYNPNLMKSNRNIEELKKYQPGLGQAIQRFVKNQQKKDRKATSSQK